jgi:hypothetical protein
LPYINIDEFVPFLEKYANHYVADRPEWKKWTSDVTTKFWAELAPLVESHKCELQNDGSNGRILMLEFYFEVVNKAYENLATQAEIPFPDERNLGITVPPEQIRELDVTVDIDDYMKNPQEANLPVLKIVFPDPYGSALVLASHVPRKILEASLLKVGTYIKIQNNKDYFFARLATSFQGKEASLRDILYQIELKPLECITHIEGAGEFACIFWPYFCSLIRMEMKKKSDLLSLDLAALQSVYILEFYVGYYRSMVMREKERDLAIKEIESKLEQPPYVFSLQDIMKFTNANGRPLTDAYGQEDLENFINKKSFFDGNTGRDAALPPLLIFHNRFDEQVFISKSKVFPLLTKQLGEARPQIRKAISNRWSKLIKAFKSEPAMENDKDFEKLLIQYTVQLAPTLVMLLDDKKLFLVQEELAQTQGGILDNNRVYDPHGNLVTLSTLFMVNRKDLLTDVKVLLPFWYSIPIISAIIAFFKQLGSKKKEKKQKHPEEFQEREVTSRQSESPSQEMKRAALEYQAQVVPHGHTADTYLRELQGKWRKVIDADAKKQLVEDVRTQIKRKLKPIMDARGNRKMSVEVIEEMADSIIMVSPALTELNNSEQIHTYVALYLTKLLINK